MSEPERALTDEATEHSEAARGTAAPAAPLTTPSLSEAAVTTVLDLDEVMSQARLVEKEAYICMRGDLEAERDKVRRELLTLVDADGRILEDDEEKALTDENRARELVARDKNLTAQMWDATRVVRFRALPEDKWSAWDKAQPRDADGKFKNPVQAHNDLVSKTAIAPTITIEQMSKYRSKLASPQITEMVNKAFDACTTGGVDIPKSLPFLVAPRRDSSGMS